MAAQNNIGVKVAGAWVSSIPYARVAGAWVAIQEGWVRIAGVWTQFYSAVSFLISPGSQYSSTSGTASISCEMRSTGLQYESLNGAAASLVGSWVTPNGAAAGYEMRMTVTSGTFSTGTVGSWLAMTSTQTWTVSRSTVGVKQAVGTLEIRDATTLAVVASGTIDLTAERF